ncbi:immunoglobulin-like domain-containing protein [Treponema bryantii]|uniref:immunoglobulin-like domain-containing protein n=1 Tax=Treponema bryantii TaxID=163 RepID=UPI002B2CF0A4|nr:hypothetical protein TRBR_05740 [Treponema bryantii]
MKKMQKFSVLISVLFLLTSVGLFTSCDLLLGKAKDSVEKIETEIIDEALAKMGDNFISSYVDADTDSITLPKTIPGYESVRLSWTSSNEAIINPATGAVTHNEGTDVDEVNLTATLSYDKKTRTKVYTVEVEQKSPDILGKAYAAMADDLIPTLVTGESITLPKTVPGYSDVTITWTSSDDSIIKASTGAVTHQAGTGDDEVTLTATLTYEGKTKTKEYTVKVPQADKELTDEEILEAAKSEVVINYTGENFREEVAIPETITVHGKTVAVSVAFAAGSAGASFTTNGNNVLIEKDLIEQTAKLNISLSYNGDFVTKEVSIEVPAVTEIIYYHYDNSTGEIFGTEIFTNNPSTKTFIKEKSWTGYDDSGAEYSYELLENYKIRVTTTKIKSRGKWSTLEAMAEEYTSLYSEMINLMNNPPSTYSELYETAKAIYLSNAGEGASYMSEEEFLEMLGASKDDDAATQAAVIQTYMAAYYAAMGLSEDYTIDDLIADEIEDLLSRYPKNAVYTYRFWDKRNYTKAYPNGVEINFEYQFDNTKPWYNQLGSFYYYDYDKNSSFRIYPRTSYIYINSTEYKGKWDKKHTVFTATYDANEKPLSSPFSITVTDNKDGTVTISGGILTASVNLAFQGYELD